MRRDMEMKKRWLALYVENRPGVLARIAGLISGKSYNLHSLTVGETEDETVSRMTICVDSDDATFEQIKKQLNHCVEVIKVTDYTNTALHMKEIMYLKVKGCTPKDKNDLFNIAQVFGVKVVDYGKESVLLECVQTEERNTSLINLVKETHKQVSIVRSGSVAVESISIRDR